MKIEIILALLGVVSLIIGIWSLRKGKAGKIEYKNAVETNAVVVGSHIEHEYENGRKTDETLVYDLEYVFNGQTLQTGFISQKPLEKGDTVTIKVNADGQKVTLAYPLTYFLLTRLFISIGVILILISIIFAICK